jgi:hypothetical protein
VGALTATLGWGCWVLLGAAGALLVLLPVVLGGAGAVAWSVKASSANGGRECSSPSARLRETASTNFYPTTSARLLPTLTQVR